MAVASEWSSGGGSAQRLTASMESSHVKRDEISHINGSAQRLTASMESSPTPRRFPIRADLPCSTPYGINGIFTRNNRCVLALDQPVLNALRHQWNLHALLYTRHGVV